MKAYLRGLVKVAKDEKAVIRNLLRSEEKRYRKTRGNRRISRSPLLTNYVIFYLERATIVSSPWFTFFSVR